MCRLLVPWPSRITLDLLLSQVVERIGKSVQKRLSNQLGAGVFFSMQVLTPTHFPSLYGKLRHIVNQSTVRFLASREPV